MRGARLTPRGQDLSGRSAAQEPALLQAWELDRWWSRDTGVSRNLLRRQDAADEQESAGQADVAAAEEEKPTIPLFRPYVGSPHGDWFLSTDNPKVECEDLRISYGGGMGPPYEINVVNATSLALANGTNDEVQVLERVGLMGMPGLVWYDLSETKLEAGTEVALQIIDSEGTFGYSVSRFVKAGHLNEFCHYPGAFWPPARWDSTHFILILLFFLAIPFAFSFLPNLRQLFKQQWAQHRDSFRFPTRSLAPTDGEELQERRRTGDGTTHVLGDDDDERTSLEDEDRPLLRGDGAMIPDTAPPGYEDAVKEDPPGNDGPSGRVAGLEEDERSRRHSLDEGGQAPQSHVRLV
ncbi:hypothetical protein JCM11251_004273 [Rhodosporidiobolus azoricus]